MVNAVKEIDIESMCKEVIENQEPVFFEFNGNTFALISKEEFDYYEDLELAEDSREAEKVLAEMKAKGEKPIPWEEVKDKYGFQE